MPSSRSVRVGVPWAENPLLRRLTWTYAAFWVALAIAPWDRQTWLLENGLVVLVVAVLAGTHARFPLSNVSYASIFAFLVLHAVGAHYTYSEVPAGGWVRDTFGLARNHYDRVVHFAFGLLLAYPLREIGLRVVHVHRVWSYLLPPVVVLALSSIYEIIESWAAQLTDPSVGLAYVGAQGDVWDGQKDMTLAWLGSLVAMLAAATFRWGSGREAYLHRITSRAPGPAGSPGPDSRP